MNIKKISLDSLERIQQYRQAGEYTLAANVLLEHASIFLGNLFMVEFRDEIVAIAPHLTGELAFAIQKLRAELHFRLWELELSQQACELTLTYATTPTQQGQIYHRLGKIKEESNQDQALDYYKRAIDCLEEDDPTLINVLIDRAWIYIHRQKEYEVEKELELLGKVARNEQQKANIDKILGSMYRRQGSFELALEHTQRFLAWAKKSDDRQLQAQALANIARIYAQTSNLTEARKYITEASNLFKEIQDCIGEVVALLNLGEAYHLKSYDIKGEAQPDKDWVDMAIEEYHKSLKALESTEGFFSIRKKSIAYYNLADAHCDCQEFDQAAKFWRSGYEFNRQQANIIQEELDSYTDLLTKYEELKEEVDKLRTKD